MSKTNKRRAAAQAQQKKRKHLLIGALALAVALAVLVLIVVLAQPGDGPEQVGSNTAGTAGHTAGNSESAAPSGDQLQSDPTGGDSGNDPAQPTDGEDPTQQPDYKEEADVEISEVEDTEINLSNGLTVTGIGSYTGIFMEDGSDEVVSRVLMITVENTGERTIQYAQIQLTDSTNAANFSLTTLPPGESAVLLEQSRMAYADGKALATATVYNLVYFPEEPTLCDELIEIQGLNGVLNITNVSGADITGDVVIYYKNASSDMLYGGITYRVTITGGIKAGQIRQITASHFSQSGSRVMWVTVG